MPSLTHADQSAILDALRELYAETDLAALREMMIRQAARLVSADFGSFNEFSKENSRLISSVRFPDVSRIVDPFLPAFSRYFHEHPILQFAQRTGRQDAQRFSDVVNLQELGRTALFNEYFRPVGVRHQMIFSVNRPEGHEIAITLNRGGRDFSLRDRALFDQLRPHYARAYSNAVDLARLRTVVNSLEDIHGNCGRAMLMVNADFRIGWLSQCARQWLRDAFGGAIGEECLLPIPIQQWLRAARLTRGTPVDLSPAAPLRTRYNGGVLTIALAGEYDDGKLSLLFTRETPETDQSLYHFPQLTPREREVLQWIADGKSNPEIACILGLSVRTVYKHVENIFVKLGVESRAAAMLQVLKPPR